MAGFGKFKLTDAIPKGTAGDAGGEPASAGPPVKGMPKAKARGSKGAAGAASHVEPAEQAGRGKPQAGRQQKGK
ncbi:hypothetical protein OJF2_42320 [Aquisphaera giovannonii]|uniref:Uncharacterized protein n=1 Tax=Aquisphaera giovannonii TaxID=406548 RepID=A0A5B9W5S9_9BACT|nr:hypothetical protein [Aquisphaera giovannonii]QEH35677.1 hypothetical protein OJF2_42320 [Aquisphaera giovannonii]